MALTLREINRFPVKSCRGEGMTSAVVEPWGLAGDRRWVVVDDDGVCVTAREHRRMLLVTPTLRADASIDFSSPDAPDLHVAPPVNGDLVPVRVWSSSLDAMMGPADAHAWFSKVLGKQARLVYLDDPTRRHPNPDHSRASDYVSFADGYPLLLATSASLDQLNDLIATGARADEGPIPMTRFRPSVVIDGSAPWEEDGWRLIRIGDAIFRVVKGCPRCAIPMTDPDTAARTKEPIATLARHRRWDGETWFGMNLIPDTPGVTISVGDPVEILESEPAPDGPPR